MRRLLLRSSPLSTACRGGALDQCELTRVGGHPVRLTERGAIRCHTSWLLIRVTCMRMSETASSASNDVPVVRGLESFEGFYRRELSGLIALAFALSRSRTGAEDLAQEALMSAYRNWEQVGRLDKPEAWVRKVLANNAWSFLRRVKAESRAIAKATLTSRWDPMPRLPDSSIETWDEVGRLPKRQAQVVALYYVSGMTMQEIADLIGCSKETVNTHLRRARETLARRLGTKEVL